MPCRPWYHAAVFVCRSSATLLLPPGLCSGVHVYVFERPLSNDSQFGSFGGQVLYLSLREFMSEKEACRTAEEAQTGWAGSLARDDNLGVVKSETAGANRRF